MGVKNLDGSCTSWLFQKNKLDCFFAKQQYDEADEVPALHQWGKLANSVAPYVAEPFGKLHTGKTAPLAGTLIATIVGIRKVAGMSVGFHLERIQVIGGVACLAQIAQSRKRIPEIKPIEAKPRVMCILRLTQMDHLVVLGVGKSGIQPICIVLLGSKNMAEHRYRGIPFPTEQTVHGGRHVDNGVRPRRPENEREKIQFNRELKTEN